MSEDVENAGATVASDNELPEENLIILYYAGQGFYRSDLIGTAIANGFTIDDLTEISQDDYDSWFNPPEGKYGAWVDGKPVLLDIPTPDYVAIATQHRETLIAEANTATYPLSLKLQMGRTLTASETAKVNAWLDYIDVLNDTDISDAPDVQWPTKPA